MQTYLRIGILCTGLLASSCSNSPPKAVSMPPPPYKICAQDELPELTGCKKEKPRAAITIRGHHE